MAHPGYPPGPGNPGFPPAQGHGGAPVGAAPPAQTAPGKRKGTSKVVPVIRIDDRDWLPPMLIRSSFSRAVAMREQGGNFTLTPAKGNKPATIVCALKDGTRLTGRFTIEAGRVTDVVIDPPVGK